jgi:hypothetical protein
MPWRIVHFSYPLDYFLFALSLSMHLTKARAAK